jgi:hypothetical protein
MSNFGRSLCQPKKNKLFLGISFFCQHNSTGGGFLILKQIIVCIIFIVKPFCTHLALKLKYF